MSEFINELKKGLDKKIEDGKVLYFYTGLGWVDEERLSQADVINIERVKKFLCDPRNSHNCHECPENNGCSACEGLPCGQQKCWVDCHCEPEEEDEDYEDYLDDDF